MNEKLRFEADWLALLIRYIYDIFCLKYSHFKDDLDYDFF